jgi:hypothetical protein
VTDKNPQDLRATFEDVLRGISYLMFVVWPIALLVFPPKNLFSAIGDDLFPRAVWLGMTILAALVAAFGAFRRYDLKVELPGILGMQLGPVLYSFSNWWYVAFPDELNPDPTNRIALAIFALLPSFLLLPRTYALTRESRRQKTLNRQSIVTAKDLVDAKAHTASFRVEEAKKK